MTDGQTPSRRRPATHAEAAALASAVRLRIIRLTARKALTNKEIAQRLGKDPATTLYHVRKLVAAGFLVAQPERTGARGAREIPYLGTRLSWFLDDKAEFTDQINQAALAAYLEEVADAGIDQINQVRLVLQLDQAGVDELAGRMEALLEEFLARPVPEDGQDVGFYVAWYPSR